MNIVVHIKFLTHILVDRLDKHHEIFVVFRYAMLFSTLRYSISDSRSDMNLN